MVEIPERDPYIQQRTDCTKKGLSTIQKLTAVMRMLAYGIPADATDEYCRIAESTANEALKRFCRMVVEMYKEEYLRTLNQADIDQLMVNLR